jgi:uncharacterized membrane protein
MALKILSFFFPLVGIILYFVKKKEDLALAKSCLKMALISMGIGVVTCIIGFIGMFAFLGTLAGI